MGGCGKWPRQTKVINHDAFQKEEAKHGKRSPIGSTENPTQSTPMPQVLPHWVRVLMLARRQARQLCGSCAANKIPSELFYMHSGGHPTVDHMLWESPGYQVLHAHYLRLHVHTLRQYATPSNNSPDTLLSLWVFGN